MKKQINIKLDRRTFLGTLGVTLFAGKLTGGRALSLKPPYKDDPAGHGMLLFGERSVYLSHLPMFDGLNPDKTAYTSPHRYQVILEVVFRDKNEKELQELYIADRKKNPKVKIYTINPAERFVLPEISPVETPENTRTGFTARAFRGHFEKGGVPIGGLENTRVEIKRIINFRQFDPTGPRLENLEYIIFGKPEELFLAHYINRADNFDQIISVETDKKFSTEELQKGIRLSVPERKDVPTERLKEKQRIVARVSGSSEPKEFEIRAVREFYFEEGELLLNAKFDPTEEERLSGF